MLFNLGQHAPFSAQHFTHEEDMHPNAELARELERCVITADETLANAGLRKGLLIRSENSFVLTNKGTDFVAKWGQSYKPKPAPKHVAIVTDPAARSSFSGAQQQPAHQSRSFYPAHSNERNLDDFNMRRDYEPSRQFSRQDGFRDPVSQQPARTQSQPSQQTTQYGRKPVYRGSGNNGSQY